jgi:predicted porin
MKKNLIALAVAAAVAAPMVASADATIYGRLHEDFGSVSNGDESTMAVTNNASRIGFKGSEDLGNGLKAIWQIESSLGNDAESFSGGSLASRNTFVGLSGGFGTALIGKHDTPYKIIGRKIDLFGDQYGDTRAITNGFGQDARLNNVVAYATPDLGGFGVLAAYAAPNAVDNSATQLDESKGSYSINGTYTHDMFWIGAAYQDWLGNSTYNDGITAYRLAGSIKLAGFKIVAGYTDQTAKTSGAGDDKLSTYGLGAAYTIGGKHVIKGQYYQGEYDPDGGDKVTASTASVGYDYKLSKKTTVGAFYSMISNDSDSSVAGGTAANLWKSPLDVAANSDGSGKDPSAVAVYMKVNF